jgi:hypothetical protein
MLDHLSLGVDYAAFVRDCDGYKLEAVHLARS